MAKKYNIRWSDTDTKELSRAVKNFNAKVGRLEKKYAGMEVVLPEKVTVSEMKSIIGTRNDLKREISTLQRFTQRGSEKLVTTPNTETPMKITKWQVTEMNRRKGIINRTRRDRLEKLKEIQMTSAGKPLGYSVGEFGMTKAEELSLKDINAFTPKMTKYDVQHKYRALRSHSQSNYFTKSDQRLLNNYIGALEKTYGKEAVADIVKRIEEMDFNEFYSKFRSEPGAFEFASDIPNDADIEAYLEQIKSTWMPEGKV